MAKKIDVEDGALKTSEETGEVIQEVTSLSDQQPNIDHLPVPILPATELSSRDKFHGQGGSYVVDAVTQTRKQAK